MKHFQHIRIAILAAICVFAIGRLHSESLADREPRLVSGEVLPIDLDDTLADETLSLLDTRKSLVSKEETLIDESLCIIDSGGFEIGAYRSSVQGNRENVRRSPYASSSLPVQGDPYYNGYGAYLEAVAIRWHGRPSWRIFPTGSGLGRKKASFPIQKTVRSRSGGLRFAMMRHSKSLARGRRLLPPPG